MFDGEDFGISGTCESMTYVNGLPVPSANDCRSCGLCIDRCPTFQLSKDQEETPRYRLRILEKCLSDQSVSPRELQHLDNCLQCRACEPVCPSRMPYSQLFNAARAKLRAQRPVARLTKLALALIAHKRWRYFLFPLLANYLHSGLQKPLRASGLLKKLALEQVEQLASQPTLSSLSGIYAVKRGKTRGRVALFTGCLAEHFDRSTLQAAIKLLNTIGYEVVVPDGQVCCGALHQHLGQDPQALIDQNINVFYSLEVQAILHTATGCGAMLSEYHNADPETSGWFRGYQQDIQQFLLDHWPQDLRLAASTLHVAVHEPCSQRNVLNNSQTTYALLGKIPGLITQSLPDKEICCGAGGSYMLSHPHNAGQLRTRKRQVISTCQADLVVSSNFGCGFYLNAQRPDAQPRVLHPLQLLADRL